MSVFKTGMLLAAMTALFLTIGAMLGGEAGLVIAFVIALGMNGFAYWNSDKMVLRMHNAKPVSRASSPELYGMVEELARNANMPTPKVYIIETDQPNAFATGRDPDHAAVAATTGIMRALTRDELAGVMAHELAHIKNRDTLIMTVAATIAGAIGFISQYAMFFGGRGDNRPNPIVAILIMILAPMAAMLVQMAISRTREFAADREGAMICGRPDWLASALQKIERFAQGRPMHTADDNPATAHMFIINPLSGGGLSGLFRTHPPTEQRIRKLNELTQSGSMTGPGPSSPGPSSPGPAARRTAAPSSPRARRMGSVPNTGNSSAPRSPWQ